MAILIQSWKRISALTKPWARRTVLEFTSQSSRVSVAPMARSFSAAFFLVVSRFVLNFKFVSTFYSFLFCKILQIKSWRKSSSYETDDTSLPLLKTKIIDLSDALYCRSAVNFMNILRKALFWVWYFLAPKFCTKKPRVKRRWNWLLDSTVRCFGIPNVNVTFSLDALPWDRSSNFVRVQLPESCRRRPLWLVRHSRHQRSLSNPSTIRYNVEGEFFLYRFYLHTLKVNLHANFKYCQYSKSSLIALIYLLRWQIINSCDFIGLGVF